MESQQKTQILQVSLLAGFLREVKVTTSLWQEVYQDARLVITNVTIDSHANLTILQVHIKLTPI